MEVDEIQRQASKFQKISCNGSSSITDNSTNPNNKLKGNLNIRNQNHQFPVTDGGGGEGGGVGRLCGWPLSRIVRVSRASGGKDRHSKVLTSKGLRDRRVRLSVTTAIQFYDLQDRLGYDQPSKAVEWLIKAASSSIAELPSLDPSFTGADSYNNLVHNHDHQKTTGNLTEFEDNQQQNNSNNNVSLSKSSACSSTSETSKGSGGISLSKSENRIRARERARDMAAKKEKEKETAINSSFTDLLTGGIASTTNNSNPTVSTESRIHWTTATTPPMDFSQIPQFNNHQQHFSFLQENFAPVVTPTTGGENNYDLNFSIASSSSGGGLAPGFNRGTLQSNLVSVLPHNHYHHVQRFQPSSSMVDGSTSTNFPFFIAPTIGSGSPDHFPYESHLLQLYDGGDGGRHADHHKGKSKN